MYIVYFVASSMHYNVIFTQNLVACNSGTVLWKNLILGSYCRATQELLYGGWIMGIRWSEPTCRCPTFCMRHFFKCLRISCIKLFTVKLMHAGFHLGFLSRGKANLTIVELRGRITVILKMLFISKEYYEAHWLGRFGGLLPQENFNLWDCFWWLLRPNLQGWGEACCLYTVASVNRFVKSMYILPQGTFWRFRHTLFT